MKLKVNEKNCIGCQLCQLACSGEKRNDFNLQHARIHIVFHNKPKHNIVVCRQCKSCKCIEACEYDAFKKDEVTGGVYIDTNECQACLACLSACIFQSVKMDHKEKIPKVCDLCKGHPRCTEVCITKALTIIK